MKTLFTESEVREFLSQKMAELQGELILFSIPPRPEDMELDRLPEQFYVAGRQHGSIDGKLEVMRQVMKFFDYEQE